MKCNSQSYHTGIGLRDATPSATNKYISISTMLKSLTDKLRVGFEKVIVLRQAQQTRLSKTEYITKTIHSSDFAMQNSISPKIKAY